MIPVGVKWFLTRTGPCATAHKEAGGFIRSKEDISHPDIQFQFVPLGYKDDGKVIFQRDAFMGVEDKLLGYHANFQAYFP